MGSTVRRGRGIDLAIALACAVAANAAYLDARVVPINDTLYDFANFQLFYGELFFHGDLARWYPYGTYGLQADYEQITSLAPMSYLLGAIGVLLRVSDAALLFKLAAIGEQLLFVFGTWRLAGRLFPTRATVLALSIAAAGTTVWYAQQWWDLRIYALLPLLLSFLFAFVETRRARDLWLAGLVGVAWSLGGLPYWIPVWVATLAIVGGVAVTDWRATVRALARSGRADWLLFAGFAIASAAYAWFVLHALDGTVLRAIDRDPLTGKVDLENFRTYGGNANLVVVANALLFGWPLHLPWGSGADNSVYLGLLPVLGLAVAVVRERSRIFLALMAGALALVWLAMGGVFTELVYHVPGFAYFRHVGLTFGIVKVLLLVASGFGLERVFARGGPRLATPILVAAAALLVIELVVASPVLFGPRPWQWLDQWGHHVLVRLAIYGALLGAATAFSLPRRAAVLVALVLDLGLYQVAVFQTRVPKIASAELLEATRARAPFFQPDRRQTPIDPARPETDTPDNRASQRALDFADRTKSRELYWYVYQFASFDPCRPQQRTDYAQRGVDRLLALDRQAHGRLDALLGCGVPKLRVVGDARIARSNDEARDRLREAVAAGTPRPTVIELAAVETPPPSAAPAAGRVSVERFTLGELVAAVEVDAPGGAWLVYDDANHPSWRASVDGAEVEIAPANLAWKAVRVPHGKSTVRFWFQHGANHYLGTALAFFGLTSAVAFTAWITRDILRRDR